MKWLLILLCASVSADELLWDANPVGDGVTNYTVALQSFTYGTNSMRDVGTNTSAILPRMTNGVWQISVRAQNEYDVSKWATVRVVNVKLEVPAGKFYVEKGSALTSFAPDKVVTGPVTLWYPTSQKMGFFSFRPFFVSAASPKAPKLVKSKTAAIKRKPVPVKREPVTPFVGPVNLDPAKALRR